MAVTHPPDLTMTAGMDQMFDNDAGDKVVQVGRARYPGTVNSVEYVPGWSVTGAATNNRTLTLINRRGSGAGTTVIASVALTSGTNLSRGVAYSLPITSAGAALAVGDVLEWQSVHVGTGLPEPGGRVIVQQSMTF